LFLETSRPGTFAVGDVRSGSVKRVAAAIGEGSVAVRLAYERLQQAGQADPIWPARPLRAVISRTRVLLTEAPDSLRRMRRTSAFDHWKSTGNGPRPPNADSPNTDGNTSAIQEIGHHPHDTVPHP
jgi:hypothetical protein